MLTAILFNATHNALVHGEAGGLIRTEASVHAGVLHVSVRNRPGENHQKLLAVLGVSMGGVDTFADLLSPNAVHGLQRFGFGSVGESTFLGLDEMRDFSKAFQPPADVHLWVNEEGVAFEIDVHVTSVVAQSPVELLQQTLPEGMLQPLVA